MDTLETVKQQQADGDDVHDPAILAAVPSTTIRYTKEELLKLRKVPASQRRPDFLDAACFNQQGVWDPWLYSRQADAAPPPPPQPAADAETGVEQQQHAAKARNRASDPRERLRKEQDGIVLSPQRRSFNSGCFVPLREPNPSAMVSTAPAPGAPPGGGGGKNERRIGSGRILGLDDFGFRGEDRCFERRCFGREFETAGSHPRRGSSSTQQQQRGFTRRESAAREEEPEWFSSGPISQNDTIELRGFDDALDKTTTSSGGKKGRLSKKRNAENGRRRNDAAKEAVQADGDGVVVVAQDTVAKKRVNGSSDALHLDHDDFNLDAILKDDTFPGLLSNGVATAGDAVGSRFSRWFQREKSPTPPSKEVPQVVMTSRRSSLQDAEQHQQQQFVKLLLNEERPGASEAYFAPISPAPQRTTSTTSMNLMQMLQQNATGAHSVRQARKAMDAPPSNAPGAGKILSVEELEGKMRPPEAAKSSEEDVHAFKRLFAQMNVNSAAAATSSPATTSKPMSIMEMLTHSQQKDADAAARYARMLHQDVAFKLQQVHTQTAAAAQQQMLQKQQHFEMLAKLINNGGGGTSPLPDAVSVDLLRRPEAQAILQGLKRGDITPQHLYQQLANPAMQPRHREMLHAILKVQQQAPGAHSPNYFNVQQQQQQLRVSPLPSNAYCVSPIMAMSPNTLSVPAMPQRIPSPRELQVHTQNIMQRALIKKKLEEQEENFRKKQQQQRASPANKTTSSPTPLAFMPTSVMRKLTADKEDAAKEQKDSKMASQGRTAAGQWLGAGGVTQFAPKQAGRAIVKANNYQAHQQEFFQLQQRILQQQQQTSSQFQQQLRQQHQNVRTSTTAPPPPATNTYPPPGQGQTQGQGQTSWLRQQNFGDGGRSDLSPTSDQLARWFSPDLLERARKGNVPSIPANAMAQHALSLEEIERQTTPVGHN